MHTAQGLRGKIQGEVNTVITVWLTDHAGPCTSIELCDACPASWRVVKC